MLQQSEYSYRGTRINKFIRRVAPWCSGYHYCTILFNKAWTQFQNLLASYWRFGIEGTSDNGRGSKITWCVFRRNPGNIYLFKVNKSCEICSKFTIRTPEWRQWCFYFDVFIVNFEHVSFIFLVFLLLTSKK